MSDKVTTKLAVLFHASAPKLNRKSLLCIGSEAPPPTPVLQSQLSLLFSQARVHEKKKQASLSDIDVSRSLKLYPSRARVRSFSYFYLLRV